MILPIVIYAGSAEQLFWWLTSGIARDPFPPAGGARLPACSAGGRAKGRDGTPHPRGTVARVTAGLQARNELR